MDKLVKQHYNYRWLSWFGINAITIGNRIFYSCKEPPDWLRQHEFAHVKQFRRIAPFGIMPIGVILFYLRYWIEFVLGLICYRSVVDAYEKISFEIEAFEAGKEVT